MSLVGSLQDALAGEHAAVYGYGVIGGVADITGPVGQLGVAAYEVHRRRRDRLEARLRRLGAEPVPAEPGYALPAPVVTDGDARRLARRIEDRCAVLYAALVAATTGLQRREAASWLVDAATQSLAWGAPATALPGAGLS
jgi:hypothetical protein